LSDDAQNCAGTAKPLGVPFKKGDDPRRNTGGRPQGLGALIRERSSDGKATEIVDLGFAAVRAAQGVLDRYAKAVESKDSEFRLTSGDMAVLGNGEQARKWLGDQLWGKAKQRVELNEGPPRELEEMPDQDFQQQLASAIASDPKLLELVQAKVAAREKTTTNPTEQ